MQLQINDNDYITGYAEIGEISEGIEFEGIVPDDFAVDYSHYRLTDGQLIKDPGYISTQDQDRIRDRRQAECFAVVDRPLWFADLPADKQAELRKWRQAWFCLLYTSRCV